jgi:alcohol dehydrogenase class IV
MPDAERGAFVYANPGVIHWGAGCARQLVGELGKLGLGRAFLITTRSIAASPELAGRFEPLLGPVLVGRYTGITEHAPAEAVAAAAAAAREARPDALISLGGGSPIDAAKAVAFSLATGLNAADPETPSRARRVTLAGRAVLPHFVVPTTLSGAELSSAAGFTDASTREKTGVGAPELLARAVFYDAEFAVHTPLDLWLGTGVRALDHAIEGMLAPGRHPFSDTMSLEGLRLLRDALPMCRARLSDLDVRTRCQLGAWFSYTLPSRAMTGLSHTLGKRLGSRHGIPHGVTSALLLPHVMRYLASSHARPLAGVAEALGVECRGPSIEEAALRAADATSVLIESLGLPRQLSRYGLSDDDLVEAARPVARDGLPLEDLVGILRAAG